VGEPGLEDLDAGGVQARLELAVQRTKLSRDSTSNTARPVSTTRHTITAAISTGLPEASSTSERSLWKLRTRREIVCQVDGGDRVRPPEPGRAHGADVGAEQDEHLRLLGRDDEEPRDEQPGHHGDAYADERERRVTEDHEERGGDGEGQDDQGHEQAGQAAALALERAGRLLGVDPVAGPRHGAAPLADVTSE
jgi:hypothetical protein